ncbi:MAG: UvrD-helicase domain-containing protein [Vicinamibacterales bacterium]
MTNSISRNRGSQPSLFGSMEPEPAAVAGVAPAPDPDARARQFAVDPVQNVVLEASAGTGKTSVLVWRYINLLKAGVDPANILAMTFTRKAAAEMRERIIRELKAAASRSEFDRTYWNVVRDRLGDIAISTIDAFCLSLLREFPLEADLDPGFDMADETEVPRLVDEALDRSMRIFSASARRNADIALVLAQLGVSRTRLGLALLLERRLVAWKALDRFLARGPKDLTAESVCRAAATALQDALGRVPGGVAGFLTHGPVEHPRYQLLLRDLRRFADLGGCGNAQIRAVLDRASAHFLTAEGTARRSGGIPPYKGDRDYASPGHGKQHRTAVFQIAPEIERVMEVFTRDLNVVLARGVRQMFAIALDQYRRALDDRSVLDFNDVLQRALDLLRRMDEFSQSRFRLESRYHHVLVDEFQDTSRAQWELVSLLIQSWGEGMGLATEPSIFIVGDRKQSIYRFRDAEVAVMQEAARYIEGLRPTGSPRHSIRRSFRAVPQLLEFVNDLFSEMSQPPVRPDDFTYTDADRFPVDTDADRRGVVLGIAASEHPEQCAAAVATEIARIILEETIRDRESGIARSAKPGDIAILFRSRTSHREFQDALETRGIPAYVYKGLGFFDADEIKDVSSLIRYLANPNSDLRAAAFLRSRFVRLSDAALARLTPDLAAAILDPASPPMLEALDHEDRRVLHHLRTRVHEWLAHVDRVPPADLIERVLRETAYSYELRGPRRQQAWENLKKMRGLVRRIQNRGYATLKRIADHLDALTPGDESNAVIEALDAVNLMTVHAAKGLEFPIVFVVNLARGATGPPDPVRIVVDGDAPSVSIGPFVSETDEAERDREKQETRRLLYVALTRARDRLYLSSSVKEGVLSPGRGSLAEVLPQSIRDLFNRAAALPTDDAHPSGSVDQASKVSWIAASGHSYDWRVCRDSTLRAEPSATSTPAMPVGRAARFGRLTEETVARRTVTEWVEETARSRAIAQGNNRHATTGTLVHRLFQARGTSPGADATAEVTFARTLLRPDECAEVEDVDAVVDDAVAAWRSLSGRADVPALLSEGRVMYEVPFSMMMRRGNDPVLLRGTIDCVVQKDDGSFVIVEFKTGRPSPSHQRQLDVYLEAAAALYPGARIVGRVLYAD